MSEPVKLSEVLGTVDAEEFAELKRKVDEIHQFISGIAGALNSPMIQAMIPAQYRGMLGG